MSMRAFLVPKCYHKNELPKYRVFLWMWMHLMMFLGGIEEQTLRLDGYSLFGFYYD